MRAALAEGGLISSVHFSLYVDDTPSPLHPVELILYADDTTIIASTASRRCSSATWNHTSTTFNCGWVNGESQLISLRAPPDGASSSPD